VSRWDRGSYEITRWESDRIEIHVNGKIVQGPIVMTKVDGPTWRLVWVDSGTIGEHREHGS
jgi:hypothetical protein